MACADMTLNEILNFRSKNKRPDLEKHLKSSSLKGTAICFVTRKLWSLATIVKSRMKYFEARIHITL